MISLMFWRLLIHVRFDSTWWEEGFMWIVWAFYARGMTRCVWCLLFVQNRFLQIPWPKVRVSVGERLGEAVLEIECDERTDRGRCLWCAIYVSKSTFEAGFGAKKSCQVGRTDWTAFDQAISGLRSAVHQLSFVRRLGRIWPSLRVGWQFGG